MIFIIFASVFASFGTFILRKGDLLNIVFSIFKSQPLERELIFFTFLGIILNLIAIGFWQYSSRSQIPFNVSFSTYLSLTLIMGYIVDYFFGNNRFDSNLLIGVFLIISGIIISNKSLNFS